MATTNINYSALEEGYDLEINKLTPVLTKRQQITHELNQIQTLRHSNLHSAQQALLNSTTLSDDQSARQELDDVQSSINNALQQVRSLVDELRYLADPSDPRVRAQVDATKNQVQQAIQDYYRSQTEFDRALRDQVWRRYEIANPEASPEEVEHGVQQVLAGTEMVQGARTRQARDAQAAVMERSAAIRKIEQDLMALSELSQQVAELVRAHEPMVETIEENAEKTAFNYEKGNEKIGHAIISARNARKYKWYILLRLHEMNNEMCFYGRFATLFEYFQHLDTCGYGLLLKKFPDITPELYQADRAQWFSSTTQWDILGDQQMLTFICTLSSDLRYSTRALRNATLSMVLRYGV
ncbi:hypothetical protein APSETT444_005097 [Aspergillus pseudonomiae]